MASRLGGSTLLRATDFLRERECPICHKRFKPIRDSQFYIRDGKKVTHYCSWGCYREARKKHDAEHPQNRSAGWETLKEDIEKAQRRVDELKKRIEENIKERDSYPVRSAERKQAGHRATYFRKKLKDAEWALDQLKGRD